MTGSNLPLLGQPNDGPPTEALMQYRDRQLSGLPFFDDLPEVRCQPDIVTSKHLVKSPLALVTSLPSRLLVLSRFGLVLLHFGLKIRYHRTPPRNKHTPQDDGGMRPARKDGHAKEILQRGSSLPGASSMPLIRAGSALMACHPY
jgi:hypothetical protein